MEIAFDIRDRRSEVWPNHEFFLLQFNMSDSERSELSDSEAESVHGSEVCI